MYTHKSFALIGIKMILWSQTAKATCSSPLHSLIIIITGILFFLQVKIGDIFKEITLSEVAETSLTLFHERTVLTSVSQFLAQIAPMQIQTYKIAW